MPTTRLIQPHFRTLGGMDATTPPHLVDESKWIFLSGMRPYYGKLVQLPRLTALSGSTVPEVAFNLPTQSSGFSYIISINETSISRVKTENPGSSLSLDSWVVEAGQRLTDGVKMAGVVYADQIWFLGTRVKLRSTDGSSVKEYGIIRYPGTISTPQGEIVLYTGSVVELFGLVDGTSLLLSGIFTGVPVGSRIQLVFPNNPQYEGNFYVKASFVNTALQRTILGIGEQLVGFAQTVPTPGGTFVITIQGSTPDVKKARFTTTSTSGAPFRVLPGQMVCLRGFQNPQYNGIFSVVETPTTGSFIVNLRANPGTTSDPNTGTMELCDASDVPSARFIESWFDHIVVLNCTYKGQHEPSKLRISDLYRPWWWEPTPENEADEYDLVIAQGGVSPNSHGTGLAKLRDMLFAYTPDAIFGISYVGLPKVIQVQVAVDGIGAMAGTLISSRDFHFFFDSQRFNFYQFDGRSDPQPIGDAIIGVLGNILVLYGQYVDYNKNEVSWVLIGSFTSLRLTYNWVSKSWYVLALTDKTAFFWPYGGSRPNAIDDVATVIDTIAPQITFDNDLALGTFPNGRLYGQVTSSGESASGESLMDSIVMETKDFTTDLQRDVEVDRITIHADYTTSTGIDVYVSARNSLQSPLNYQLVGRWTKATVDGIVSFKALHGRVFRYKFVPVADTAGLVFYSFTDNVFNVLAER